MQDLSNFFKNPFIGDEFSFETKQRFSEEHIGKLSAMNTTGQYDSLLTAMVAAHQDYFGVFTDVKVGQGVQQAQTQIVDKLIRRFEFGVSNLNRYLEYTQQDEQPIYQKFFPNGVMEFTQETTKSNAESHINRLVTIITEHTAEAGGAAVLAEFVALQNEYTAARSLQLVKKAQTHSSRTIRDAKGLVWAEQLFDNLLVLAREFKGQPKRLGDFFDQSILRPKHRRDKDGKGLLVGWVKNAHTDLPERGVCVHVIDAKLDDAYTKLDGSYRSKYLPIGTYKVRFSKADFEPLELKIDVLDKGDTTLNVSLTPKD